VQRTGDRACVGSAKRRGDAHRDETALLVHGDVHQWNALAADGGFKLVDRDGLLAEAEYDLGIIMREAPWNETCVSERAGSRAERGLTRTRSGSGGAHDLAAMRPTNLPAPRSALDIDTGNRRRFAVRVDPIRFAGEIRYWNPEKASGLAVADVPPQHVEALGGLKQQRVRGTIAATEFVSNVMPAGGGRLALSVSRAMMTGAGVSVGEVAEFRITGVGRD
jgi:hypothetical protein